MNAPRFRFALAAVVLALTATAPLAVSAETQNGAAGVQRALGHEQAALAGAASRRIAALVRSRAPVARPDGAITLASRGAPSASAARTLTFAVLDAMPSVDGDAQWRCLAEAIYFESRGEPLAGQIGVAEVVLNRVDSRAYPDSICGVTNQGVGSGRGCQFSYACDGLSDEMRSATPRARAEKLARMLVDGRPRTITTGATYFHARYVSPSWARKFSRTATIGNHVFYRSGAQLASN